MTDLYDAGCAPWTDYCSRWPCSTKPDAERRLMPDERGFWCCPSCGGSYGRKVQPDYPELVHAHQGAGDKCEGCDRPRHDAMHRATEGEEGT